LLCLVSAGWFQHISSLAIEAGELIAGKRAGTVLFWGNLTGLFSLEVILVVWLCCRAFGCLDSSPCWVHIDRSEFFSLLKLTIMGNTESYNEVASVRQEIE
jgi:hypothetical protein